MMAAWFDPAYAIGSNTSKFFKASAGRLAFSGERSRIHHHERPNGLLPIIINKSKIFLIDLKHKLFQLKKTDSLNIFSARIFQLLRPRFVPLKMSGLGALLASASSHHDEPLNELLSIKPGFTIIESVLTMAIIATALTSIFSLETKLIKSVFGTHDIIHHLIGVRNFIVADDQEEYYKQGKGLEKKFEDYTINYEPKTSKQFSSLSSYKNIVVEKIKLSSKSVFKNQDEFAYFRFNPEGKK